MRNYSLRNQQVCSNPLDDTHRLPPESQELFQAIRWKRDLIILNTEEVSKILNLKWPVKHKARLYERVNLIRKLLRILHENNFINKVMERGKTIEKKDWVFYVRKRKLISFERKIN